MKKWISSKHDSRDTIVAIQSALAVDFDLSKSAQVENFEPEEGARFVVVDGKFTFVSHESSFLPFIGCQPLIELFPSLKVDEGAIKFILNGADVMRPGVVSYDEWGEASRLVIVKDAKKERGLAVGRALIKSSDMPSMGKGVCVKNLHHLGDRFWTLHRQI